MTEMLNESHLVKSNDSCLWLNNQNRDIQSNGKETCFVCLKDIPELSIMRNASYQEIYNKNKKYFCKSSENDNINKDYEILIHPMQNLMKPKSNSSNPLIQPCSCDKAAHLHCLINYCSISISYKCSICKINYSIEFKKIDYECNYILLCYSITIILILIHSTLLTISLLCIANFFDFSLLYSFWCVIVGTIIFILNLVIGFLSLNWINEIFKKNVSPSFLVKPEINDIKNLEYFKKIDLKKGEEIYDFFSSIHSCERIELMEKKFNNKYFLQKLGRKESNILKFIADNNRIFNLNKFAYKFDMTLDKINPVYNTIIEQKKTSNINVLIIQPLEKNEKIVRSNSNDNNKKINKKISLLSSLKDRSTKINTFSNPVRSSITVYNDVDINSSKLNNINPTIPHILFKFYDLKEIQEEVRRDRLDYKFSNESDTTSLRNKNLRYVHSSSIIRNEVNKSSKSFLNESASKKDFKKFKYNSEKPLNYNVKLDELEEDTIIHDTFIHPKKINRDINDNFLPKQKRYFDINGENEISENFVDDDILFEY